MKWHCTFFFLPWWNAVKTIGNVIKCILKISYHLIIIIINVAVEKNLLNTQNKTLKIILYSYGANIERRKKNWEIQWKTKKSKSSFSRKLDFRRLIECSKSMRHDSKIKEKKNDFIEISDQRQSETIVRILNLYLNNDINKNINFYNFKDCIIQYWFHKYN